MVVSKKSGDYATYEVSLTDGSWSPPLGDAYQNGFVRDPATLTPIGIVRPGLGSVGYEFFNAEDQKLWRAIARSFKDELVTLVDWSDDRNIVMANVFGPKSGDAIYVIDRKAHVAGLLSPRYARIEPADIGPVQTLTYKAADGTDIPAYLTLPPGRPAKNLPLIAFPHGGPEASDSPGFDWWAQAMASRGYAVLQPQFRGSTGFGEAHRVAGYGQWGRKMQSDVSDGVRHLAGLGTIDPRRVCIVGASYGGYAAMAGVSVEQGVYRCASAIAGVSDLRRMLSSETNDAGGTKRTVVRYWQRYMGAKNNDDSSIDAWSPARLASKVSVPLQLIHGKDDIVVPMEQSNFMANAMKDAGKPVDMVVLPGEDHWLSRPATRTAMLAAVIGFLEKHNPPDPAPAAAPAVGQ
jgi:dipeptidyl aminopeptidase/acylaminoacyl peptidase